MSDRSLTDWLAIAAALTPIIDAARAKGRLTTDDAVDLAGDVLAVLQRTQVTIAELATLVDALKDVLPWVLPLFGKPPKPDPPDPPDPDPDPPGRNLPPQAPVDLPSLDDPERYAAPTYDDFLGVEGPQVDTAYRQRDGGVTSGDVRHTAWRRFVEGWTHRGILADILTPGAGHPGDWKIVGPVDPVDPPPKPATRGPARKWGDRAAGDQNGARLLVGLSRFYWLHAWMNDRDRVLRELDQDAATGYDFGRVFGQVQTMGSDTYWAGLEVTGDEPGHLDAMVGLTQAAADRGLMIEWTLIAKGGKAGRQSWRRDFVRRTVQALAAAERGVFLNEIMNEPGAGGDITKDELVELHGIAKAAGGGRFLTATGATWATSGTDFDPASYRVDQRDIGIVHLDRDTAKSERQDRPWRQGWDIGLEGLAWVDNEPIGPGASVNVEDRPQVLRSHRTVAFLCRAMASVLHGDPGIRGRRPWTDEPAYFVAPQAKRFLPGSLANGRQVNANDHFPDRPFDALDIRSVQGNGVVRVYSVDQGGYYWTVGFGPISPWRLRARKALQVRAFDQERGPLWERQVGPGEVLDFDGSRPDVLLQSAVL